MALTPQDISRIADLARLELQPAESERMLTQINGFFDIVEQMRRRGHQRPGASGAPGGRPSSRSTCACATTLRANPTSATPTSAAHRPVERGLFLVPKVIE